MQEEMKELYVNFMGSISAQTIFRLLEITENAPAMHTMHLIITSLGGSAHWVNVACRTLPHMPFEVITHAYTPIASAAVVLYCIGKERSATPSTAFTLHPVAWPPAYHSYEVALLEENLNYVKNLEKSVTEIIAETVRKRTSDVLNDMQQRKVLNAEEAKEYGLVTHIVEKPITIYGKHGVSIYGYDQSPSPIGTSPASMTMTQTRTQPMRRKPIHGLEFASFGTDLTDSVADL